MYATCFPDHCFCEALRTGAIVQPADAWSGLAFAVVALLILWRRRDVFSVITAILAALVGVGTFYFHARLTYPGQFIDNIGMYVLVLWFTLQYVKRPLVWYAIALPVSSAMLWYVPGLRRWVFALLVVALLAVEFHRWRRRDPASRVFLTRAVGLFATGFVLWAADITGVLCSPTSIWQAHALWHILGAASVWLLYRFHRGSGGRILSS